MSSDMADARDSNASLSDDPEFRDAGAKFRQQSRSPVDDIDSRYNEEEGAQGDEHDEHVDGSGIGNHSSNDDSPMKKRRRSRKGMDKKFDCPHEGCGKSYSRAEHLSRHQLNHNPKTFYTCGFDGCCRRFVRQDLRNRHEDRHNAKRALSRRDSVISHIAERSSFGPPGSVSPETNRPPVVYPKLRPGQQPGQQQQQQQQPGYEARTDSSTSPCTPVTSTPPTNFPVAIGANGVDTYPPPPPNDGFSVVHAQPAPHHQQPSSQQQQRLPIQTSVAPPYEVVSPVFSYASHATPQPPPHMSHQTVLPFNLSPSSLVVGGGGGGQATNARDIGRPFASMSVSQDFPDHDTVDQSGEMMMLDQMSMPATVPVFGSDSISNKSPYTIPEDFVAYLFNTHGGDMSRVDNMVSAYSGYDSQYGSLPFRSEGILPGHGGPSGPQQVMAVNNLLDQNVPEATISEEKSQEIFDFVRDKFHEKGRSPVEKRRDDILEGDRLHPQHVLSKRMMQAYIASYWLHFSDQLPILHKPTFSPESTPTLLLIAMMTIGAACLERSRAPDVATTSGTDLPNFFARNLRWEVFMDANFAPPSKLWVFQTLILLELYEKMFSSRELHERAHIHHATTITLMRRGRSLIGKSFPDTPPNARNDNTGTSRASSTSGAGPAGNPPDEWWNGWVVHESTRRTAFAAFVMDSIHATMFGHSTVMVAHEMRLPLPCDDSLWKATSGAEVARIESKLMTGDNTKPISFLEGLKRTLSNQEVKTSSFGRMVLMAGLLSVAWHMHQRDLQISVLGAGVSMAIGGGDMWRSTLTRAFDSWRDEYERALHANGPTADPYWYGTVNNNEDRLVAESRLVLHTLAHMAMYVDIVDCQIYARAKRLLGRTIGPQDLSAVQRRMTEAWAPTAKARDAAFCALKFISSVLVPEAAGGSRPSRAKQYSARDDLLLNRPWVLYFAALVVWCYSFALEGPPHQLPPPTTQERAVQTQDYLAQFGTVATPDELSLHKGLNNNGAILMTLSDTFKQTGWELLHEASNLLNNCVVLNAGGTLS